MPLPPASGPWIVSEAGDFGEDSGKFFFTVFPEGSTVVQVKGDLGTVLFGGTGDFQTETAGVGRKSSDQTGKVNDLDTFLTEDAVQVEIFDIEHTADFTGTVILHAGTAAAVAAVSQVELVTEAPGAALFEFRTFIVHVAAGQIVFDHTGNGAAFDESGQNLDRKAEIGNNACYVGFGTGHLHLEHIAAVERLSINRSETDPHAGGNQQGVLGIFFEFQRHFLIPYI